MIQLNHADHTGENLGGLYIRDKNDIQAVYAVKVNSEHKTHDCMVVLSNGMEFRVMQSVSEVLDLIQEECHES